MKNIITAIIAIACIVGGGVGGHFLRSMSSDAPAAEKSEKADDGHGEKKDDHGEKKDDHAKEAKLAEKAGRTEEAMASWIEVGSKFPDEAGADEAQFRLGKLLRSLGVERVVFPEIEIARSLADQMTWPNVLDYVPIDPEYSVVEITVPDSLAGTTLFESDLRRRYNIWVIGIKDALTGKFQMFPDPEFRFTQDQLLVVVGKQDGLKNLRELQ